MRFASLLFSWLVEKEDHKYKMELRGIYISHKIEVEAMFSFGKCCGLGSAIWVPNFPIGNDAVLYQRIDE